MRVTANFSGKYQFLLLIAVVWIGFIACQSNSVGQLPEVEIRFLGHKASGSVDSLLPNTLEAIQFAVNDLDGAEIDVQMSAGGTLWVWHNDSMVDCQGDTLNISSLQDAEIERISAFRFEHKLLRLDNVFSFLSNRGADKFISLDIKVPANSFFATFEQKMAVSQRVVDSINVFYNRYNVLPQLAVETSFGELLIYMKAQNPDIETYLLGFYKFNNLIDYCAKHQLTGVSYSFSHDPPAKEDIENLRKAGLKLQMWTPNSMSDIQDVLRLKPDFIQTDNIELVLSDFGAGD